MCLGSIAALQYYFARTGLLDGKGAQMAKDRKSTADAVIAQVGEGIEADQDPEVEAWETMEAPAISTYRHKEPTTEPLPEMSILRRQLREALNDSQRVLKDTTRSDGVTLRDPTLSDDLPTPQSWYEAQGLHILDTVTLSIRQARTYYITHAHPQTFYAMKSEKELRSDLFQVLDFLKRMATREFRGGIRLEERAGMLSWIQNIHDLLSREEQQEAEELLRQKSWTWREGDWSGREREREWTFLNSFDLDPSPLPPWDPTSSEPSQFLLCLSTGLRLVNLHNEMVHRSRRPFGEIKTFSTLR